LRGYDLADAMSFRAPLCRGDARNAVEPPQMDATLPSSLALSRHAAFIVIHLADPASSPQLHLANGNPSVAVALRSISEAPHKTRRRSALPLPEPAEKKSLTGGGP